MDMNDMVIVSVDDHICEPADLFKGHLSKEHLAAAPRLVKTEQGHEVWVFEDMKLPNIGLNAVVGRPPDEYGFEPTARSQMRKGTYDVHARIDDMNVNGILGSMCFGSFVGMDGALFGRAKDKTNALRILRAYNDWHIDEWCGAYPGRFIPLAILPTWDPTLMADEVRRVAAKGCHAVSVSDSPNKKGLPSIHNEYWDPLWKACAEEDVVICVHIGSGAQAPHPSNESPIDAWIISMPMSISTSAADWLYLKALQKYPNLKIALSEGGIGWIPYFMERADFTFSRHRAWTHTDFGGRRPSEVFRDHFICCFIDDAFGIENRHAVGIENICYECDYPHSDAVWPESPEFLYRSLKGVPDEDVNKMTHLNAMKHFKYNPLSVLDRADCTVGALRAKAAHIDTTPRSQEGDRPVARDASRVVTSGDLLKMFDFGAQRATQVTDKT